MVGFFTSHGGSFQIRTLYLDAEDRELQNIRERAQRFSLGRMSKVSGEVPARSKAIQQTYERVADSHADSHAAPPLSTLKRIQDHLSDIHMLGFLRRHEQNKGLSGGQYYEYELDLDPEIVFETRAEITKHTE